MKTNLALLSLAAALFISGCSSKRSDSSKADTIVTAAKQLVKLPQPYQTKSTMTFCEVIGWPQGKMPVAPAGFRVSLYADGLDNPRNIYVAPNGDVFVSEANTEMGGIKRIGANLIGASKAQNYNKSANRVTLLRDTNNDGLVDLKQVFISNLNQPYGMLILNDWFYVANTDALWRYPYKSGQTRITDAGKEILSLPAGGYNNHWTRNLRANKEGSKIYISVGSGTNDAEHGLAVENRRANILEINPDGSRERIFASGLRNPVGMDFEPENNVLYTSVNERDDLGDNLVPDYLTSVKEGGFYGWPFAYFGKHQDPNYIGQYPDLVAKSITPDLSLGAHTASLGLAFYTGNKFPARYLGGAFIGQHGSWNRSELVGYKVVFASFANGKPTGRVEDFLTGFIADAANKKVYGRPVGTAVLPDGSILVADDAGNKIWRVSAI